MMSGRSEWSERPGQALLLCEEAGLRKPCSSEAPRPCAPPSPQQPLACLPPSGPQTERRSCLSWGASCPHHPSRLLALEGGRRRVSWRKHIRGAGNTSPVHGGRCPGNPSAAPQPGSGFPSELHWCHGGGLPVSARLLEAGTRPPSDPRPGTRWFPMRSFDLPGLQGSLGPRACVFLPLGVLLYLRWGAFGLRCRREGWGDTRLPQ